MEARRIGQPGREGVEAPAPGAGCPCFLDRARTVQRYKGRTEALIGGWSRDDTSVQFSSRETADRGPSSSGSGIERARRVDNCCSTAGESQYIDSGREKSGLERLQSSALNYGTT